MSALSDDKKIDLLLEYFRLADQGSPEVLKLFHEDVKLYFPKFGFGVARQAFLEFVKGFDGALEYNRHDYGKLTFISAGDHVVVERTSRGKLSGRTWAGGETPGARFCNVFTFRDDRIASIHIYLDPDYTGADAPRLRWGGNRRW
jgi:ketosteroid isomerase-like protein